MKIHQITYGITSFFKAQLFYIFLAQTLHTFYKSSPSKCKFSDFLLLRLKFTKFFIIFQTKVSFSSMFGSLFGVMRDNSSVHFLLKLYMLLTKVRGNISLWNGWPKNNGVNKTIPPTAQSALNHSSQQIKKVLDHEHIMGEYRGPAHNSCNLNYRFHAIFCLILKLFTLAKLIFNNASRHWIFLTRVNNSWY